MYGAGALVPGRTGTFTTGGDCSMYGDGAFVDGRVGTFTTGGAMYGDGARGAGVEMSIRPVVVPCRGDPEGTDGTTYVGLVGVGVEMSIRPVVVPCRGEPDGTDGTTYVGLTGVGVGLAGAGAGLVGTTGLAADEDGRPTV
jgi:hypothetical protein